MAAEIAAANTKSTRRPVGNVLIPGPVTKLGEVKRKLHRQYSDRGHEGVIDSPGQMVDASGQLVDESEEEGGGAEEWLGKEDGFVSMISVHTHSAFSCPSSS